jgi:hypothetical protein
VGMAIFNQRSRKSNAGYVPNSCRLGTGERQAAKAGCGAAHQKSAAPASPGVGKSRETAYLRYEIVAV